MKRFALPQLLLWTSLGVIPALAQTTWELAPGPSSVEFRVSHLVFSEVKGRFLEFSGEAEIPDDAGEDFSGAHVVARLPADSIYTGHKDRDNELRGKDFFWASRYPALTFESTSIERTGEDAYEVLGDLTMRGVTHTVELRGTYEGRETLPTGEERIDFLLAGSVNRFDYGLRWNEVLEAGRALVGKNVAIRLKIALVRPADDED
jgi:polyisoprenoid-binding protein YceI